MNAVLVGAMIVLLAGLVGAVAVGWSVAALGDWARGHGWTITERRNRAGAPGAARIRGRHRVVT